MFGGKHTIPLMEALAVEGQKAGGLVMMFLGSDVVERSYFVDVPEKYLEIEPRFIAEWVKTIDIVISLPGFEDSKAVYAGIPEARFAKASQAAQFMRQTFDEAKVKVVGIGYPTKEEAANNKVAFPTFERMH